jgi:hypothetical protein
VSSQHQPAAGSAFYSIADANGFLGVVGLLNSLRLVGHEQPFFLLDCGLTDEQRELLLPHAQVVAAPRAGHPTLLKPTLPLARPSDVMVLLDGDVIVTRNLGELIAVAAGGLVVAFENDVDRHRPEWGPRLGLGPLPRRPYVNAGHLILPPDHGKRLLEDLERGIARVGLEEKLLLGDDMYAKPLEDALFYADQDVLNAILAARVPEESMCLLDSRLAPFPPFAGLRADPETLRCEHEDGSSPFLLHHVLRKPWLAALPESVYALLLRRLLTWPDVPVRLPRHVVPLRLREGRLARADRARAHAQALLRSYTRGRLGIRPRIESRLARRRRPE